MATDRTDAGFVREQLAAIAADLVARFALSEADAARRVAEAFAHWDFTDPDAVGHLGHELPDYWADWVYYGPDDDRRRL